MRLQLRKLFLFKLLILSLVWVLNVPAWSLVYPFQAFFPVWSEELKEPAPPTPRNKLFRNPAFYWGTQVGYADNNWDQMTIQTPVFSQIPTNDSGFAYNLYLGYNYNFVSVEGGYISLPKSKFNSTVIGSPTTVVTLDDYALDFVGKITIPILCRGGLYAKAGVGYISSTVTTGLYFNTNANMPLSQSHVGPVISAGANYAITRNLILDVSWMRFSGQGEVLDPNDNFIPTADLFLAGIIIKIPVTQA